jgi:hypothetical protein
MVSRCAMVVLDVVVVDSATVVVSEEEDVVVVAVVVEVVAVDLVGKSDIFCLAAPFCLLYPYS